MSSSDRAKPVISCPASSPTRMTSLPSMPAAPVTRTLNPRPSMDLDLRVVADHEAIGARARVGPLEHHVAADQARLHPVREVGDARSAEHDRVLDLRALDQDV